MPFKLGWMKKKDAEGNETPELTMSDEDRNKMLEGTASKDDITQLGSKFDQLKASLDSINSHFSSEEEAKKQERERKAREAAATTQTQTEEELNELFLTNPVEAAKRLIASQSSPANQALLLVRADTVKRQLFEDEDKFPYYTGEVKAEIDKLLSNESAQNQNNLAVIEHAYFSTVGRRSKELAEGKLKSRFASSEGNRGTATGNAGGKTEDTIKPLDADGQKVARMLGYDDAAYAKMLHEEGIGAV